MDAVSRRNNPVAADRDAAALHMAEHRNPGFGPGQAGDFLAQDVADSAVALHAAGFRLVHDGAA